MSVRDDLELDISNAVSEIDRIATSLNQVTSEFKVDLADAISVLRAVQTVTIEADTAGLATEVDTALGKADTIVEIDGETRNLTQEIDAAVLAADTSVIVTGDASEITGDINAAVDAADTTVQISGEIGGELLAEGAAAAASVDAVGESAQRSESALATLGAKGGASLGKLGAAAAGIVGVGLLVKGLTEAVNASSDLAESQSKVEAVFKENTSTITTFASTSAQSLGLANQEALEFAGTFGNLFTSLGLSTQAAADLSPQVVQLGADLASFNNLEVPDALEKLRAGLIGEIEPLRALGVSFNAAQVEQKALELGLQDTNGTISEAAKVQARWALIIEQTTNAQGDFAKTSDGLANQLRILQGELGDVAAEAGEAFLPTLLELIGVGRELLPALLPLADVFSTALLAVAPLIDSVAGVIVPLLSAAGGGITRIFDAAIPVVEEIAGIVDSLLAPAMEELGPSIDDVAASIIQVIQAGQPLLKMAGELAQILGPVLAEVLKASAFEVVALANILTTLLTVLGPVIEASSPLLNLAKAFGFVDEAATTAATGGMKQYQNVSSDIITNADQLAASLKEDSDGFAAFIATGSEFASAGSGVLNQLRRTGIELEDLQKQLGSGEEGFKDFVSAAVDAGQIKIEVDGVAQTGEDIQSLEGSLAQFLNTEGTAVVQGAELTNAFIAQTIATRDQTQAEFEAIAAAQGLTDAQIAAIGVQAQQQFGVDTYITRLQVLAAQQQSNAATEQANAATLQGSASAWVALTQAAANGTLETGNAAAAAQLLGVDLQTATTALGDAEKAVNTFVDNALAKFPTVTSVYEDLKAATNPVDPTSLTNNLNAATLASLGFQQNIDTIAARFPEVAKLLQEQGPEAAGAFAQSFLASSDEIKTGLEQAIVVNKSALGSIGDDIKASIGTNAATAKQLAEEMTTSLDQNLKFGEVTEQSVAEAGLVLQNAAVIDPLKADAKDTGQQIGSELSAGIALGLSSGMPLIEQYARDAITRAEEAARDEAQSESPSRLFADLGKDLTAGLAVGLSDGESEVVREAERIIQAASKATGAGSLAPPVFGVPTATTGALPAAVASTVIHLGGVQVQAVPGVSQTEAQQQGRWITEGILEALPAEARIV